MRVVIAFVPNMLRPEVKQLGEDVGAEFADVSGSDMAYGELVARLWSAGQSFLLLEHDVLAGPKLLKAMWACPEPWCAGFAWRYTSPLHPGEDRPRRPTREKEFALFLNKFSADLIHQTPNIIGAFRGLRWTQIDLRLLPMLKGSATPCQHGPVVHLHQQHPPWAMEMSEGDWDA
jgi:hypothetical protein